MTMSSYDIRNDDSAHTAEKVAKLVVEINSQVALFRDLLICVGQSRDGPELRERIRKVRRQCVDTCKHASSLLLPSIKNDVAEGIPVDNQNFVHLFSCTQLMSRELRKCKRLVQTMPVDMTEYYENKPGPSGMGGLGIISQLLLCKTLQPDFQQEEICSIEKDSDEIMAILKEMQEYMPQEETGTRNLALTGEDMFSIWSKKRTRRSLYSNMSSLCCTCKPAYL
ncbi:regulator of G-protein signaling 7-binding protein-like isoform X2 [Portunus trituberculatus]|uniref:regulator of G-protein signaling 7-binding protein-like isoform X2 n=1 Tax=Portunus trituberculatus TaxID=210409 RepID=UPI001E1D1B30|nr:regulator of G-protein signaling 7-binding protein-like isoform X2 [Portunus trituberculatus]